MLKKGLALLSVAVIVGTAALSLPNRAAAQEPAPDKGKAAKQNKRRGADALLAKMTETLTLTDEQQKKIKPILDDMVEKIRALRQGKTENAADTREKLKSIREDTRAKVEAILTAEQKKKFAESNLVGKAPNPKAKDRKGKGRVAKP